MIERDERDEWGDQIRFDDELPPGPRSVPAPVGLSPGEPPTPAEEARRHIAELRERVEAVRAQARAG